MIKESELAVVSLMDNILLTRAARALWPIHPADRHLVMITPILFGLCVYVSVWSTQTSTTIAAIWPANGIMLAALLLAKRARSRRLITIACFLANILADHLTGSHPVLASVGLSFANMAEVLIAAWLLRKTAAAKLDFVDTKSVALFIACTALATVASTIIGATVVYFAHGANFIAAAKTWYIADVLGLLVITPAFALAASSPEYWPAAPRRALGLAALLIAVSFVVFTQSSAPLLFLVIPVTVAIGFSLGARGVAFTTLFLTAASLIATYHNVGPTALMPDMTSRVWVIQLFCLINHFTAWFVTASITERDTLRLHNEQLAAAEANSKRRLDVALNAMKQGLCLFDADNRIVVRNDRFLELYRLPSEAIPVGTTFDELKVLSKNIGVRPVKESSKIVSPSKNADFDQFLSDGRCINICQQELLDGSVVCTYTDVSSDRKAAEELRHASLHDALTGLGNRRYFTEVMAEAFASNQPFALLLIDVDHFKEVNDTHGHTAGDDLLKTIAARLKGCVRAGDDIARLGGDEFAVIARGLEDVNILEQVARRMLELTRDAVVLGDIQTSVSLSIGGGFRKNSAGPEHLFKEVDTALYEAKEAGRDQLRLTKPSSAPSQGEIAA